VTFLADQPQEVDDRVGDFWLNLCLAIAIVTVLVALFMGWRNGLLVGLTVAVSIGLTLGAMPLFSVDINQISLLSLIVSLGIIVDAGIVAIDNIEQYLRAGVDRQTAAWKGVQDLWFPLLTSTLVAIFSFVPFKFVGGGSIGDFISALGVVTVVALAMSILVAYFVTPIAGELFAASSNAASARGLGRATQLAFDTLIARMQRAYVPLATATLQRPVATAMVAGVLVLAAVAWIPQLGIQFFPSADRNQFFIAVNAPEGTDIRATEAIVERIETLVARESAVVAYGSFIGQGAPRFYYNLFPEQPKPSYAQVLVDTVDAPSANRLVDALGAELRSQIAGARVEVKRFEQGPSVGPPIAIRLSGEDPRAVARASASVLAALGTVPGAVDVRDSLGVPTSKLAVHVDDARAALAGVSDATIQQLVSLAYGGVTATEIREPDRQTPVVVRLPKSLRGDADELAALDVRDASGRNVPLGELVTAELTTQTSVSTLRDGLPTVTVFAETQGRLASAVLADFRQRIHALAIPPGVTVAYAGEYEEIEKSFRNLGIAFAIGLLINQMVLLWEFRTLRLSLLILSAVPLGIVGAVFGLALTRNHFGFVAALGIASLGGIVTNHAIVLFEYANRELRHGVPMEQALIAAGTKRLRPILLTIVTSIAGLLPLAFSSQTLWRPFCWAVIFGLGGSMVMTLVAIPALYRLVCGRGTAQPAAADEAERPVPLHGLPTR
jgi:multidrug efflux pump subunit AcrB